MRLIGLAGCLLNLVYFAAMLFGLVILIFAFILIFPPVIGIVFALLVAAGVVIGVHNHVQAGRLEDTEANG